MKKTKIIKLVHVVNDLSTGGVASIVIDLCNNADHSKFDVSIICLSNRLSMLEQKPLDSQVKLLKFDYFFDSNYSLRRYIFLSLKNSIIKKRAAKIISKILEINPTILHFHILPRELQIGSLIKKENRAINLVFTDHLKRIGASDYKFFNREILKLVYRRWYKHFNIISVSKSVENSNFKNKFLKKTNYNKLIENKVKYPTQTKKNLNESLINVVYVARLSHVKGHYDLLKAWKMLPETKKCKLWLIGDGELEVELKEYVKNNIQNDSVVFTGAVNNVDYYLSFADIGVFPSYKEGLPLALLEQLAMGIPMITSDIEELTDIISDGENGLVYELGSTEDLLEKIEELIADAELRKKLGENAKILAKNRFCNGSLISHYEQFYDELLHL
ncbi:MAG: glycosyltransferase family 4 protein [Flavobacteriaceae bacterium]|nr:glycosyltransferase family 4 protein [Flavobacteriaceae bacterium]